MAIPFTLHILAALIWVGGMFFALLILRPSAQSLDLPSRVGLWSQVLSRFIPMVWLAVIIQLVTGYWMIFLMFGFGEVATVTLHIRIMEILGWIMITLFLIFYFKAFLPMKQRMGELLIPEAGLYIERGRKIMQINLVLGIVVISVVAGGRYWYQW
ncbi:MAG: hypothetical protein HQL94_07035 [Magnetococcales bacterium]|nr:hypothetical protein [Magnetococcales bacterium]